MKMRFLLSLACLGLASTAIWGAKPVAPRLIFIGVDGLASYVMPQAKTPVIDSLMQHGSYTLKKRSVMPSKSAINWSSIFTGAPTEMHGYTKWGSKTPEIPSPILNANGHYPTVYSLMQEQRPGDVTACLYDWDGIKYVIDSAAVTNIGQTPEPQMYDSLTTRLTDMSIQYIRDRRPTFLSIIYGNVDEQGHLHGWGSPEQIASIEDVDRNIGRLLQTLKDEGLAEETIVIVSADHGGIDKKHGGITLEELETPFVISGPGVRADGEYPELMMQYDTAATMAYILGLDRPQCMFGRPMTQVFDK